MLNVLFPVCMSPALGVISAIPRHHPRPLKTPRLSGSTETRILVKILEVKVASPHIPVLVEILAQVVAGPGLAEVSMPLPGAVQGLRHLLLQRQCVGVAGVWPRLPRLAGHQTDERRARQLLRRHHPRGGPRHPGCGSEHYDS